MKVQTNTYIHGHRFSLSIHNGGFLVKKKSGLVLISLPCPTKTVSHCLRAAWKVRRLNQLHHLAAGERLQFTHVLLSFFAFLNGTSTTVQRSSKLKLRNDQLNLKKLQGGNRVRN